MNTSHNSIGVEQNFASATPKTLPEGKMYHVFILYRDIDEDRTWVRHLISKLQSIYNFVCCDHAIDFEPDCKITENIQYAITNSMKTVVVLTKQYVESYEIEYALLRNMDMKERILIPLLKEECEIPYYLRPFTYIDARGDIDTWIHKLVSAIELKGTSNLEILHEESTHFKCRSPVFNTRYVPQRLRDEPTNLDPELFHEIVTGIASRSLVTGRHCRTCWIPTIFTWITISIIANVSVAVSLGLTNHEYNPLDHGPLLAFLAFVTVTVMPIIWFYTYCKGRKEINEILLDSNRKLMTHKLMMYITWKILKATITEYIQHCLKSRPAVVENVKFNEPHCPPSVCYSDISINGLDEDTAPLIENESDSNPSLTVEEQALKLLLESSIPYLNDFQASTLETTGSKRHISNAICLCQYMELKGYIQQAQD